LTIDTKKVTNTNCGRPRTIDYSRLTALVNAGKTDAEIAEELGVTKPAVAAARRRLGLAANGRRGRKRKIDLGEVKKQIIENGKTAEALARALCVSKRTVVRAAHAAGIEIPPSPKRAKTTRLRPWPWFGKPRRLGPWRKLRITDYAMVMWHRTKYEYLEVNGQKTGVLVLKECTGTQGLPRRYYALPTLIPGRVGRRGRGGGFISIAARTAAQALNGQ
jgi:hypothetical protein